MNHKEIPEQTHEEEPKISYEILYSAHETVKDFEKLAEVFPKCDIYVPECSDWDPGLLADFQALSLGEKTPRKFRRKYGCSKNSAAAKESKVIYQSQKPILFADLGKGHKLEETDIQADALYAQSFEEFENGNFPVALQKMRESMAKVADYSQERERMMKANLETKIKEMIGNNPQLKNKKEIKVLLALGTVHTSLFHSLKQEKPSTTRQFANLPSVFLSEEEAFRRIMLSKELNDELLAKIFVESFFDDYFERLTKDTDKKDRITRQISYKISLDEIRKLSENWNDKKSKGLSVVLREFFRSKGIKIPKTEKEIDEILKPLEE